MTITTALRRPTATGLRAALLLLLVHFVAAPAAHGQDNAVFFSKFFSPDRIAPGNVSTLVFEIGSEENVPVTDLAFTDVLPAGVVIATPASLTNTCGGTATAPDGGTTIQLINGRLDPLGFCQVSVDVTGGTPGSFVNTSGDLTSSAGNSGSATDTLTVDDAALSFTKTFDPDGIVVGQTTTITFEIDNPFEAANFFSFVDDLPGGLTVSLPSNASNTCGGTLIAVPGTGTIELEEGTLEAFESCAISVDVTAPAPGTFVNRTSDLESELGSNGKAVDVLVVSPAVLFLDKTVPDDPAAPGGLLTFRFELRNVNRTETATDLAFTDDLDAALSGLQAVVLPSEPCGPGSTIAGTSTLTFAGATLEPGESCVFDVVVEVPSGAAAGTYVNTTSELSGEVGGVPSVGLPASEGFQVVDGVLVTKSFDPEVVEAGNTVAIDFTATNFADSEAIFSFDDPFVTVIPNATLASGPGGGFCGPFAGAGATLDGVTFVNLRLAAGASCSFSIAIQVPAETPPGDYLNVTSRVEAQIDGETVSTSGARDELQVVNAPLLAKEFLSPAVRPGETVDLEFTLAYGSGAAADATDVAFSDDVAAALAGLTLVSVPGGEPCGAGSTVSGAGTGQLTFAGGTLAPGEQCSFTVAVQVPAGAAPGSYLNTTSEVTATVSGEEVTSPQASAALTVVAFEFDKEFTDDPAVAGGTVTLLFTLRNLATSAATDLAFTDDLAAALPGLTAVGQSGVTDCGAGATLTGTTELTFSGGELAAGDDCSFTVTLQVPADAAPGEYPNQTSAITGEIGGEPFTGPQAADGLAIASALSFGKEFVDDPVRPGETVTLRFTITNAAPALPATDLAFTDDLGAVLPGLAAVGLPASDVCGAGSEVSGTSVISLTGGTVAAGGLCTFDVTVQVPAGASAAGELVNTTSALTGTVGGMAAEAPPASDTLMLSAVRFTKSFDGPSYPGGSVMLSFTIENASSSAVDGLSFLDDLDAVLPGLTAVGLPASGVCGPGSQLSGTSQLTFSGGSLGVGGSCTFAVTLAVPADAAAGDYPNATSELTAAGLPVAEPATATLRVDPPPGFAKDFTPSIVPLGGTSTLTLTIDNGGATAPAGGLDFTDPLPAGIEVAAVPNASTTCTGGTLTAAPGSGTVGYTGGSVAAGGACTVQVDVTGTAEGDHDNVAGPLTSSLGNSGTAADTLRVVTAEFLVDKQVAAPVLRGAPVELEFTVVNGSAFPLTGITFSDDLDAVLPGLVAEGLPQNDVCGAGSQLTGTSAIVLTGGSVAAGSACSFTVTVDVPADAPLGSYTNTTSTAEAQRGGVPVTAPPASDVLEVVFLTIEKAFSQPAVDSGGTVDLTFTLTNPDPVNAVSGVTFTDDLDAVLPGLEAVGLPQGDVCGFGSQLTGTSTIALTGGSLAAGGQCVFTVTLQVPATTMRGTVVNVTSPVQATVDGETVVGDPIDAAEAEVEIGGSVLEIPTLSWPALLLLASLLTLLAWGRLRP